MTTTTAREQLPTLPGKVEGIVGLDPLVLQCRVCGATHTDGKSRRLGAAVILSGYFFHRCDGRTGLRHCPDCLAAAKAVCGKRHDG